MVRRDYLQSHTWSKDELRDWFHWFHERVRNGWSVVDDDGTERTVTNLEMGLYVHAAHVVRADMETAEEIAAFLRGTANVE
jgi:hypothetical protein